MVSDDDLLVDQRGAIRIVTINRPEARNAVNSAVIAGIGRALGEADVDDDVRAVVLTSTGTQAFCSGMDLRDFAAGRGAATTDRDATAAYSRVLREGTLKPLVCAAPGSALAGGMELLMACDLAVVADTARFGFPEVRRGLLPGGGGLFVGQRVPLAVALELTMTGESIDAPRAYELGLVNRVVPAESVLDEALALASMLTALSPLAVSAVKRVVREAVRSHDDAAALQAELVPIVFGSDDAREGATAFVEKRDAVWTGRPWTPSDEPTP